MDLGLDDEQEQLVASFGNLLAKHSSSERVRDAEPTGFDASLWRSLHDTGAVSMAVSDARGGWGASMVDLSLVDEQVGRALAPSPVIEAQTAARILASVDGTAADEALGEVLEGRRLVTIAVRPVVDGVAALVPAGAVADDAIVMDGGRLLLVRLDDTMRRRVDNLGSSPLADLDVGSGAIELAEGDDATERFESAVDDWLTLTAAALVGLGAHAHEMTCAYACERHAWGVPIGTFQAVAHPLADSLTALDGARLLARKAAWSADRADPRRRELAAMAFAFAAEAAREVTYQGVHFHGGYGFMLEHDIQLFYRRARAWARVWGEPAAAYRRAGQSRYAIAREG